MLLAILRIFLIELLRSDDAVKPVERRVSQKCGFAEFGMIREQIHFVRLFGNSLFTSYSSKSEFVGSG